jgi:hypothetical protein
MTVRIKIHDDGTATLSGIPYQRLRESLTVAELHCQDGQPGVPKFKFDKEMLAYHRELMRWIRLMREAMDLGIHNTFPNRDRPLTKAERFEKVRNSEKERELMERIMGDMLSLRRTKPKKPSKRVKKAS